MKSDPVSTDLPKVAQVGSRVPWVTHVGPRAVGCRKPVVCDGRHERRDVEGAWWNVVALVVSVGLVVVVVADDRWWC
jgi:hypothetical protein